jgi:hypothetical protein
MEKKNGDSENKNIFDRDASLLFDKELEQHRKERQQRIETLVKSPEAEARRESEHKFYERVLSVFEKVEAETYKTGETCYDIADGLKKLLLKTEPNLYRGAHIIGMLCSLVRLDEKRFIDAASPHGKEIVIGHIYQVCALLVKVFVFKGFENRLMKAICLNPLCF